MPYIVRRKDSGTILDYCHAREDQHTSRSCWTTPAFSSGMDHRQATRSPLLLRSDWRLDHTLDGDRIEALGYQMTIAGFGPTSNALPKLGIRCFSIFSVRSPSAVIGRVYRYRDERRPAAVGRRFSRPCEEEADMGRGYFRRCSKGRNLPTAALNLEKNFGVAVREGENPPKNDYVFLPWLPRRAFARHGRIEPPWRLLQTIGDGEGRGRQLWFDTHQDRDGNSRPTRVDQVQGRIAPRNRCR